MREGIAPEKIRLVGNVMIDTLVRLLPQAQGHRLSGIPERYASVTMHRPANVDDEIFLRDLLDTLRDIGRELPIIFPVHPRTRERIVQLGLPQREDGRVRLINPLSYLEFLALEERAIVVITDSGGIQEETTFLGVPCLTIRENTERPITTTIGSNVLVGRDMARLRREIQRILSGRRLQTHVPPLWEGCAAERIANAVLHGQSMHQDAVLVQRG
jgi:UDP-N-acetylglucosamine 2-epimerase (non-hydrolysing)